MNKTFRSFLVKTALALAIIPLLPFVARSQSADNVPVIDFQDVPITTAIENLARMADLNYIIDPKLFMAADGTLKPEPTLTLRWENHTAADALARVLKENHLCMTTNNFTTVVRIAGAKTTSPTVDAKLPGSDTNGVIPMIKFSDVPLGLALKSLINQAHLAIVLDPGVFGEESPQPPGYKRVRAPMVSVSWHHLTAQQAIVELCENYELSLVKDEMTGVLVIQSKK